MGWSKAVPDFVLQQCTEDDRPAERDIRPILLRRADHLPEPDRTFVLCVLQRRQSFRELSALAGRSPGHLCRSVRQTIYRLRDPLVAALIETPGELSNQFREIGLRHFALGQSARCISRQTGLSIQEVLSMLAYIRGWARGSLRLFQTLSRTRAPKRGEALSC
jgi:hypothetical protein